jgi:hypothetical protein
MDVNPKLSINWVKHIKNVVAHFLAKWAQVEPNKVWTANPPHPPTHTKQINSLNTHNLLPHKPTSLKRRDKK